MRTSIEGMETLYRAIWAVDVNLRFVWVCGGVRSRVEPDLTILILWWASYELFLIVACVPGYERVTSIGARGGWDNASSSSQPPTLH